MLLTTESKAHTVHSGIVSIKGTLTVMGNTADLTG
jgi:hypothetical protein